MSLLNRAHVKIGTIAGGIVGCASTLVHIVLLTRKQGPANSNELILSVFGVVGGAALGALVGAMLAFITDAVLDNGKEGTNDEPRERD